jgi:hypothetical protein
MGDGYRVLHFRDGDLVEESGHDARDSAEGAYGLAVERATRLADDIDADHRVELWGEDSLLRVFDTADRP